MKTFLITLSIFILVAIFTGCAENASGRIKESLSGYARQESTGLKLLQVESVTYSLADSTVYYNHFLNLLADRSESFSKMARLRAGLAQGHMNTFLSDNLKDRYSAEKIKNDVDKSLQDLQQNEREWNIINDSMDLMLNAIHTTDTMKKVFYTVSFSLHEVTKNKNTTQTRKAILTKDDFKVVIFE